MLKQRLQQRLLQKLSPQQIQFIKLLQIPTVALDARIKDELENNPALEDLSLTNMDEPREDYPDHDIEGEVNSPEERQDDYEEFNVDDYLQEDSLHEYGSAYNQSNDPDEESKEIPIAIQNSFLENLQAQLRLVPLDDKDLKIGQQIIGSLDDDGYLRRSTISMMDDLAFSQNIFVEEHEVEKVLSIVQSFDPSGVGARNLQECLMIQLRKKEQTLVVEKAILVIDKYLDEFTKKHYDKLEKLLAMDSGELKEIIHEILKLNPKPVVKPI